MRENLIEKCITLLHEPLGTFAENHDSKKEKFIERIKKLYGFESVFYWNILLNAIYVLQDTELAKKTFLSFGIEGPCKHKDAGERYLRLYGILNAMYLQKNALLNLIEIFKLKNKKSLIEKLDSMKIIKLRNKAASHSSNYLQNKSKDKITLYEIHQNNLKSDIVTLCCNQNDFEDYDIIEDIKDFDKILLNTMLELNKKQIKKLFNNKGRYYEKLQCIIDEYKGIFNVKAGKQVNIKLKPAKK